MVFSGQSIVAEPNPCLPNQTVLFRLPALARKVVASGGNFGKGTPVTDTPIIDTPDKTTTYTFDVCLPAQKTGGKKGRGKLAEIHHRYTVTVHVYDGVFPPLQTHFDWLHWRIDYVAGWHRYATPQIDPANNALLYFQPEEDSVERLAIAIMPTSAATSAELMRRVMLDTPSQYDVLEDVLQKETTQGGLPATWLTFKGIDRADPDIATRSLVMALVRDGMGYVISGRARVAEFDRWERLLRCLVRSFAFTPASHPDPKARSNGKEGEKLGMPAS